MKCWGAPVFQGTGAQTGLTIAISVPLSSSFSSLWMDMTEDSAWVVCGWEVGQRGRERRGRVQRVLEGERARGNERHSRLKAV